MTNVATMTDPEKRAAARQLYAESLIAELPMSASALSERFGCKERWGYARIKEVKDEQRGQTAQEPHTEAEQTLTIPAQREPEPQTEQTEPLQPAETAHSAQTPVPTSEGSQGHDKGAMGFARAIFFTGLVWSVAANVNHAVQTVPNNPLAWCMQAVWPLLAFFLIESLVRTRNGQGGFGKWLRSAHILGGFAVLSAALFISFGHMVDFMLAWNQSLATAYATPIGIDGAALFGALQMLKISRSRKA